MSNSKRPNYEIAKASHDRWYAARERYNSETLTDRELCDKYNAAPFGDRPVYQLLRAAEIRCHEAEQRFDAEIKQDREILDAWKLIRKAGNALIDARGLRYADATLDNYVGKLPEQTKIVQQLRDYASNSNELIPQGQNVILLGPKGTGKDHLLMALAKEVLRFSGFTTKWENGCDMHQRFRESATSNRPTASPVFAPSPDILWISDPLPPSGVLTEFQQSAMFSVIDSRYSNLQPTWISINVENGQEAEQRMGAQTVDRLRHDALVLACNWPSFRQAQ